MPFNNSVVGGTVLVRNAIQSQNYVAGASGWRIGRDGTAEFNSGTFRGSIEAGSLTGQHFWVNNPGTTDVIDVYDSTNKLIFSIDNTGRVFSYASGASTHYAEFAGATLFFGDTAQTPQIKPNVQGLATADETDLLLSAGLPQNAVGGNQSAIIQLSAGDAVIAPFIETTQRSVTGMMLQTDNLNQNQLMHMASYSGTTNATGHIIFAHGCAFTPKGGVVIGTTPGGTFANLTCGLNFLTVTQADVSWIVANTGAAFANQGITFDAIFWG